MSRTMTATGAAMTVSVVVPTCGRMGLLDRCLDALSRQPLPAAAYEMIVVDDEPSHNTLYLVAGWRARTLDRGPSLARDLGQAARRHAQERFSIERFSADWDPALRHVTGHDRHQPRGLAREGARRACGGQPPHVPGADTWI